MANGNSKYVSNVCGPCNIADDIEVRGHKVTYAGLSGDDAVRTLRERCCGMPCKNYIEATYGFPMLVIDYDFWRMNGRLPTPDDRERLMNLKKARSKKEGTEVDVSDFLDENGDVWGYEPDSETRFHDESAIRLIPDPVTPDGTPVEDDSRWANVPKKNKTGKRGRPDSIGIEIDEDFEL